jgi:hypothetical protein
MNQTGHKGLPVLRRFIRRGSSYEASRTAEHAPSYKPTDSQCAENLARFIPLVLTIVPGIAYSFDRTCMPRCTTCRRRVRFV